jgi:hypothetical protein
MDILTKKDVMDMAIKLVNGTQLSAKPEDRIQAVITAYKEMLKAISET